MKSFSFCCFGTLVSLLLVYYSLCVPWALVYLDMDEGSFSVRVPVLLWQGCMYDTSCLVSSLIDTSTYPNLSYELSEVVTFADLLIGVAVLNFAGIFICIMACFIHLLDLYKVRVMHSRFRFVYPVGVGCFISSLFVFFPAFILMAEGGLLLSGSLILICNALFGICNCMLYLNDYYLSNVYTFLP